MSDPPILGTHCSLASCQALDFLPLPCQSPIAATRCLLQFCKLHALPTAHDCPLAPRTGPVVRGRFNDRFEDLLPDRTRGNDESQKKSGERLRKAAAAREIIEKNFGVVKGVGSALGGAGGVVRKERKVNLAIELRKLKARAKPCDTSKRALECSMEERVWFCARFVELDRTESEIKEFWLPKTTTIGKLLDLCAVHFKATNLNNTSQDPAKLLSIVSAPAEDEPAMLLSNSSKMEIVENGKSLWLLRGPL